MKIYLIGYMGCGKSTLGRRLSKALNYDFIDADRFIEQQEGCPIPEIIEGFGETRFRELESDALDQLAGRENCVVSTGGGMPCFGDNIQKMNRDGITLYIKMDNKALLNRLLNSKTERPLIKNKSVEQLTEFIEKSMAHRSQFYEQAKITLTGINLSHLDIINCLEYYKEDL